MNAREQANAIADKLRRAAIRAGLPVSIDDDCRVLTVTIQYEAEQEMEPRFDRISRQASQK